MEQVLNRQRKSRCSKGELLALIKEFDKTEGITIKEFCLQHKITEGSFYTARRRYRCSSSKEKQFGFIALATGGTGGGSLFAEVGAIKLYQAVPADYLKALLV